MDRVGIDLSIVIPVFNEEGNVTELADEINVIMKNSSLSWECVWVDDGSVDSTLTELLEIVERDKHHRIISFSANAGQSAALWAGFGEARGWLIATLDGDGQNDPSDIPRLIETLLRGSFDLVNGYRKVRRDPLLRKISSWIANFFRKAVIGEDIKDAGCALRVFRRHCIAHLPPFKGLHRFLPTLIALQGYRITEIVVNHRPRRKGRPKYGIRNRLWAGLFDSFGVWWLHRRMFHYQIRMKYPER